MKKHYYNKRLLNNILKQFNIHYRYKLINHRQIIHVRDIFKISYVREYLINQFKDNYNSYLASINKRSYIIKELNDQLFNKINKQLAKNHFDLECYF